MPAYFFSDQATNGQAARPENSANQPFVGGHGPLVTRSHRPLTPAMNVQSQPAAQPTEEILNRLCLKGFMGCHIESIYHARLITPEARRSCPRKEHRTSIAATKLLISRSVATSCRRLGATSRTNSYSESRGLLLDGHHGLNLAKLPPWSDTITTSMPAPAPHDM